MTGESVMNLNLLPSRAKFQASKLLWKKRVKSYSVGIIILWVVLSAGVLAWKYTNVVLQSSAQKNYNKLSGEYKSLSDTVINTQRLKYKAKLVGEVLSDRFEYNKAFLAANSFFPSGVTMEKFELTDNNTLKLSGTTTGKTLDVVELLIKQVNDGRSEVYKSARMVSLNWSKGYWKFVVEVSL